MKVRPLWIDELLDQEAEMFWGPHLDPDLPNTRFIATMLRRRNPHAVLKLAGMYRSGNLVGRDELLAIWLYLAAAHLGHAGGGQMAVSDLSTPSLQRCAVLSDRAWPLSNARS